MSQAEYEEDRDDQFEDDDDDGNAKNAQFGGETFSLSQSMPEGVGMHKPESSVP